MRASIKKLTLKLATIFFKSYRANYYRTCIAKRYIKGHGIEIGALHNPLEIPKSAKTKYVDRMAVVELRKQYPELEKNELVDIDIIDDGEHLAKILDSTQDFVIANHFLEHCQNPIGAINNMLRVLRNNGILYLSVPDKRYSFDIDRAETSIEHILRDYQEGPAWSKMLHLKEWIKYVDKIKDDAEVKRQILHLMHLDYSIHYHAWTQAGILELILALKHKLHFPFEVELFSKNDDEIIIVFRKNCETY